MTLPIGFGQVFAAAAAVLATTVGGSPMARAACPAPLADALRLVLVTSSSFDDATAEIRTFSRGTKSERWVARGGPFAATLGRAGLAWGWTAADLRQAGEPIKQEGDKRTPAGVFALGRPFGTEASRVADYMTLAKGDTFCVDDPASEHYGRIVPRRVAGWSTSGEDMATVPLYKRGVVVDYPANAARRAGSCIFVHLWRRPGSPTVGCVAASEQTVLHLQGFRTPGTAIAILPRTALARLKGCLPD